MADKYVPIFFDWIEATQELKAQEKGRLIDAIVLYARGGDWSELLEGNERYVFPMFRLQIDRASIVSEKRAVSGSKGGKQTEANVSKGKQMEANGSKPKQTEANVSKNANDYEYEDEYKNEYEYDHHDDDAHARINSVEVYAANNLHVMSPGNMEELASFKTDLPDDLIRYAIDEACANGAPRWAYVSAILRGYVRDGIKTVGDAKAAKDKRAPVAKGKTNPATKNFAERGYTDKDYGEDFYIDLAAENGKAAAEKEQV